MTAKPDEEVSFFMEMAQLCEQLHTLPGPGGILQQDGYIMMGVRLALDAFNERREREHNKQVRKIK